jgi:hypothetical protein
LCSHEIRIRSAAGRYDAAVDYDGGNGEEGKGIEERRDLFAPCKSMSASALSYMLSLVSSFLLLTYRLP